MSDTKVKSERSKAKDIRQGIVDQPSVKGKNSKRKHTHKITAEYDMQSSLWRILDNGKGRFTVGKYGSLKAAESALPSFMRYSFYKNLMIEEI